MRTRLGTEKEIQWSSESGKYKGTYGYGMTAARHDAVMASCIDGPSHKWTVLSEVSHDMAPIAGSRGCAVTQAIIINLCRST